MPIRHATHDDLPVLKELCAEFRAEREAASDLPYDPDMFMQSLSVAIDSRETLLLMLNESDGFFLGALGVTPYSTVRVAHELLWFTRPHARGQGFSLFRAYMRWARENKAAYIFATMPGPNEALERIGFKRADVGYFKRLDHAEA